MDIFEMILSIAGGIGIIGSAGVIIAKVFTPIVKLNDKIKALEEHSMENDEVIREIKDTNRLMCEGVLSILENTITGNSIDRLKDVKKKIQDYLIRK